MPGLNQLKQFTEDMLAVGDETKIRASRGERVTPIPLPKGIPEADDSDDFIIGLPTKENVEAVAAAEKENYADADISDILGDSSSSANLDSILNPTAAADDSDLSEFLNDSPSFTENLEPAEDASLESLAPETEEKNGENPLEGMDLSSILGDIPPLENSDDLLSGLPSSPASDLQSGQEDKTKEINLNEDLPTSVLENDGNPPAASESSEPDIDFSELGDIGDSLDFDSSSGNSDQTPNIGNFDIDSIISGGGDSENTDSESAQDLSQPSESPVEGLESVDDAAAVDELSDVPEFSDTPDSVDELSDAPEAPEFAADSADSEAQDAPSAESFNLDENPADSLDVDGGSENLNLGNFDIDSIISGDGEIPNALDDVPDIPDGSEDNQAPSADEFSPSDFDSSSMDGVDFGKSSPDDEFPTTEDSMGSDDDFELDSSFEIPGFSDTETAEMGKKSSLFDTVDFSQGVEDRPKNSLSDDEYIQFKKNLSNYPLNLRIAIEDFIARDEFTDEVVFEIIEKVLKKTSARQLATQLEKILDVSIDIPRDFEKRSFAEYEAYKQSFQYQLKNRIIPAAIAGVILAFVCFGLFKAGQHFIYKPVMASIHYKQGYSLLEANEFPQSEEEFKEAVSFKPVKKWFFKYAQGYRGKRQYERAGNMYKNILRFFNHDKQAGLEYAEMELYDRANYERAEEIARREVLDYHINDADGILLLGDIFLEWAEVDESKYELAKQQYLDLMQRYGSNNIYLSRMLRYYIRTDKLRDVLYYKNLLYIPGKDKQNLKALGASDWTELSGYLLEKLYGVLSKNDEYLRASIEDVLDLLNLAVKADPSNPVARYNLASYYIQNGNMEQAKIELERSLTLFSAQKVRTKKNVYREINATRTLGELYAGAKEYLKAQTVYTRGIDLYNEEHENSDLEGDESTGKLFADMGDLDYFISGDVDDALYNYEMAIKTKNDTPSINYRIGTIYYNKKNYDNALASFLKTSEKEPDNSNLLLSLGNVLSLRGDNFAAESYYSDLLLHLDTSRDQSQYLLPQENPDDFEVVDLYLKACNNLGVTLYRLARQTGDSNKNAQAMAKLEKSIRAYDALTRNQATMVRLEGSNLAAQNSKYMTHPYPDFEPAIYTDIPRLLAGEKPLE